MVNTTQQTKKEDEANNTSNLLTGTRDDPITTARKKQEAKAANQASIEQDGKVRDSKGRVVISQAEAEQRARDKAASGLDFEGRPQGDQVFTDSRTGRPSGASVGGRSFLDLDPQQAALIQEQQAQFPGGMPSIQNEAFKETFEGRGTFDNVNVVENQLDPTKAVTPSGEFMENIPVLGPAVRAAFVARNALARKFGIEPIGQDKFNQLDELEIEADVTEVRDKALLEITNKEIKKGLTLRENVGALIEAMPGANFIDGLLGGKLETPSGNVATTFKTINDYRERSTNLVEKVNKGFPVDTAMEQMQMMQDDVAELEGRMRLLINQSAVLRSDSDRVNQIEEGIERAKVLIEANRVALAGIQVGRQSGTGTPIPTNVDLLIGLNK